MRKVSDLNVAAHRYLQQHAIKTALKEKKTASKEKI